MLQLKKKSLKYTSPVPRRRDGNTTIRFRHIPRGAFFVVLGVALLILLEVALFHVLCVALLFRHVFTLHLGHVDSLRHLDEDALPVLLFVALLGGSALLTVNILNLIKV